MGNIITKAAENKSAVFSGIGALAILGYILYEAK